MNRCKRRGAAAASAFFCGPERRPERGKCSRGRHHTDFATEDLNDLDTTEMPLSMIVAVQDGARLCIWDDEHRHARSVQKGDAHGEFEFGAPRGHRLLARGCGTLRCTMRPLKRAPVRAFEHTPCHPHRKRSLLRRGKLSRACCSTWRWRPCQAETTHLVEMSAEHMLVEGHAHSDDEHGATANSVNSA